MIYLLRSYGKEGKSILKIGFTEDNNWERRKIMYTSHNPYCEFLYTIPGGTEEQEHKLHYKFREYLHHGNEWFEDKEEIINYIKSVSLEELNDLLSSPHITDRRARLVKKRKIMILLEYVLREEGREDITTDDFKDIMKVVKYNSTTPKEIFDDLKSSNHYPSITSKTWDELRSELYPSLSLELNKFFLEYDKLITYVEKIHMIVDFILENPGYKDSIIGNLVDSDKIKQQLLVLGPEKIKGLGYHITKINQAMGITIFDKSSFLEEVYNCFRVGERYTKKFIKERLGEIYKATDFKGVAKASDLGEWFELKTTQITIDGKREMGFTIIKRK